MLIPEIPYEIEAVAANITERNQRGAQFSLVAIAEGAKPAGGKIVYMEERDVGGMKRLGGIGEVLAAKLRECYNFEVRVTVLGHLQRGGSPTAFDRLLASRFGAAATQLIAEGKFGYMPSLQGGRIIAVEISQAIARQKFVPLDSDIIMTAHELGISLGVSKEGLLR